jgi:tetratricopeptide (TPR) repeat protein
LTLVLLWKNRPVGFLGTWFFAILSPTFVIPVVTEMAAERRMYLALAPLVLIFVMGVYRLAEMCIRQASGGARPSRFSAQQFATAIPVVILTLVFCFASASRLAAYENELNLWLEVMHAQPENPRAHLYAATFLESQGKTKEAIQQYQEAIRLHRNPVQAHYRFGQLLNKEGQYSEAAKQFAAAARGMPEKNANFYNAEAVALYMAGRNDEAIAAYGRVLDIDRNFWPAHRNLGTALQKAGKFRKAVHSFENALRLNPQAIDIYNDLANSYFRLNEKPQAIAALEHGLQLAQAAGDAENIKKLSAALQAKR